METQGKITIIGLGPGDVGSISWNAMALLRESRPVYLRTKVHPMVEWLEEEGVQFSTFDYLYEQMPGFREVYEGISREVLQAAQKEPVTYAVPGHPLVYEESVSLILEAAAKEGIEVVIHPAVSFLDAVLSALRINTRLGLLVLDGLSLDEQPPSVVCPVIVTQVYSPLVAADVKLTLLDYYPPEHPVTVVRAAGVPGLEKIERLPLWKLDRLDWFDHLTSLFLPECNASGECPGVEPRDDVLPDSKFPLDSLAELLVRLRAVDGCPWDREQNHLTLRTYLLEETYEVLEALQENDPEKICEELGDLLLQIVFHAQIASESGNFDLNDVVRGICEKIVRRHPHVFGSVTVKDSREVNVNWERIKAEEKSGEKPGHLLMSFSRNLPALMWAAKLQKKAAGVGFDWPDYHGPLEKVREELEELQEALAVGDEQQIENETGDVLFSVVNVARQIHVDPEVALTGACEKFIRRFNYVEDQAAKSAQKLSECSLQQLDLWWDEAKNKGK